MTTAETAASAPSARQKLTTALRGMTASDWIAGGLYGASMVALCWTILKGWDSPTDRWAITGAVIVAMVAGLFVGLGRQPKPEQSTGRGDRLWGDLPAPRPKPGDYIAERSKIDADHPDREAIYNGMEFWVWMARRPPEQMYGAKEMRDLEMNQPALCNIILTAYKDHKAEVQRASNGAW